jgi:hypothetical protein
VNGEDAISMIFSIPETTNHQMPEPRRTTENKKGSEYLKLQQMLGEKGFILICVKVCFICNSVVAVQKIYRIRTLNGSSSE